MGRIKFYAHSKEDQSDTSLWQELEKHLLRVANRAAEYAEHFKSRKWGYIGGLWHDLGKYQPEFQARLRGEATHVEHSGLGATLAYQGDKVLGLLLAFVIAGHHAGLADINTGGSGLPRPLRERLRENESLLKSLITKLPTPLTSRSLPPELPEFLKEKPGMQPKEKADFLRKSEFWTRFLFSTLVDADYLDTEEFLEPAKADLRGEFSPIHSLREHLDCYIQRKMDGIPVNHKATLVNSARKSVLKACREAAKQCQGIFSLTVPTGGGKTLSSMSFALRHAEQHGLHRVIVVIPYTSIIEQNADIYKQAMGPENVVEHHSSFTPSELETIYAEERTKRHALAAENWDAPIIVTTSVQFLESLFANSPSRCRKIHNIAKSVIILDEVQTLPPGFLLSIIDALKELINNYGCTLVLSTATPPALSARERFEAGLKDIHEIITDSTSLAADLKRVEYSWPDLNLPTSNWPELAAELAHCSQVLAVVHKRDDARILARTLQGIAPDEPIFHLSALMCPVHRLNVIKKIKESLIRGDICRVVSTQLVEAGVDLDFPVVYRALGGLDSVVQAAGRCNREGRNRTGRVVVFQASTTPPRGTPKRAMEVTESMLREAGGSLNPDDPVIFDTYFRMLYFTEDLDSRHIQTFREGFRFATVDREFKLIEDGFVHPVVVPYGDGHRRLEELRRDGPSRKTLRGAQPFTVNIYPDAFERLKQSGALEEIEGVYALNTAFEHFYDNTFGLVLSDEIGADPAAMIV